MGTLYRNGIPYVGSGGAGGVEVTQAEYDALPTSEKMNGSIYFITDGSVSYPTASQMRYDNTESGIPSTSVQGAIDELKIDVDDLNDGSIKYVDVQTTCVSGTWQTLTLPSGISSDRVINVTKRTGLYGCLWWKKDDSTLTFLRINTSGTNVVLVDTAGDVTLRVYYY